MAALLLLLLPPLLLPPGPALGNEGAAAGSCKCRREAEQPWIAKNFPERLQSCQTCPGDKLRFTFPQISVCGYKTDAWALTFWHSSCNKTQVPLLEEGGSRQAMRAEASRPRHTPAPVFRTTVPTEATSGTGQGTPEEAPRTQQAPDRTTDAPRAPGRTRSAPPSGGDLAEAGPSRLSLLEEASPSPGAGGSRVAVMSLIGVALTSVAVAVLVVCRRRRGQVRALAHHCPSRHPGEEMRCLPCEET